MPRYDDVGSLPLPEEVDKKEFSEGLMKYGDWALDVYERAMQLKMDAGLEVPCYPQLRDMNDQFLDIMNDPELSEEPYLVYEDDAILPEMRALEMLNIDLTSIKMCVTGPVELSASEFDNEIYEDIMLNMAQSLTRFVENAKSYESIDLQVVSIDEPSLGTNPRLEVEEDVLLEAWSIAGDVDARVQVHIHSPNFYKIACRTDAIDIIDIGMASSPENMKSIDPEVLESYDKGLRTGIARTDVLTMASEFNEKNDANVWSDEEAWEAFMSETEPPSTIAERIRKVKERYGDLIEYIGPDCGLGGAKRMELARKILENTKSGIEISLDR